MLCYILKNKNKLKNIYYIYFKILLVKLKSSLNQVEGVKKNRSFLLWELLKVWPCALTKRSIKSFGLYLFWKKKKKKNNQKPNTTLLETTRSRVRQRWKNTRFMIDVGHIYKSQAAATTRIGKSIGMRPVNLSVVAVARLLCLVWTCSTFFFANEFRSVLLLIRSWPF